MEEPPDAVMPGGYNRSFRARTSAQITCQDQHTADAVRID